MDSRGTLVKASEEKAEVRLQDWVDKIMRLDVRTALGRSFGVVLDQLYPPVCPNCATAVVRSDGLCGACWPKLLPITAPMCPVLGLPFEVDLGEGTVSPAALADPPPFERARSAVHYSDVARRIVSRLKYGDQPELARLCAKMMVAAGAELLADDPVLVPVPLHRFRQWQRRYNQSMELCKAIAEIGGYEIAPMLVHRKKRTAQQVGLTARQRTRNVEGAFVVNDGEIARIAGRRLVLVDDVITTGATVNALTRVLKRAGFDHIDVLSFARVVIGSEMPI